MRRRWVGLRTWYAKYQSEILTLAGLVLPVLAKLVSDKVGAEDLSRNIRSYGWAYAAIVCGAYVVTSRRRAADTPLRLFRTGGDPDFTVTLGLAGSRYWYLGMGAEEFLHDVTIDRYFEDRRTTGRGFAEVRFLLLDPDSPEFMRRLVEVHGGTEAALIASRKRAYLDALLADLAALRPDVIDVWEVRYYADAPVWLLQMLDRRSVGSIDTTIVSFHLSHRHSRESRQLTCTSANLDLFDSFARYFDNHWTTARTVAIGGRLAVSQPQTEGPTLR